MRAAGRQPRGGGAAPRSAALGHRRRARQQFPGGAGRGHGGRGGRESSPGAGRAGGAGRQVSRRVPAARSLSPKLPGLPRDGVPPLRCHSSAGSLLTKKFHRRAAGTASLYRADPGAPVGPACGRGGAGGGGAESAPQLLAGRSSQPAGPGRGAKRRLCFRRACNNLVPSRGGQGGGGGMPPPGSCSAGGRAPSPPPAQTEIRRQGGNACIYVCVYMSIGVEIALEMESGSTGGGL